MGDQSFRGTLQLLDTWGELHTVNREVDPRFELGAVMSLRQNDELQLFACVAGHAMKVAGNVMNSRMRIARLLNTDSARLPDRILKALKTQIGPCAG